MNEPVGWAGDHAADLGVPLRGFPAWLPGFAPLQVPSGLSRADRSIPVGGL